MNWRFISLAALLLPFSAMTAAQTRINLPLDAAEMRKFMSDYDNACPTCAVVTNLRGINEDGGEFEYSGVEGPEDIAGNNVLIQPIFSSNKVSTKIGSASKWLVSVRYDNGSYASFEQLQKPVVMKGDMVQIVEGRVVPR